MLVSPSAARENNPEDITLLHVWIDVQTDISPEISTLLAGSGIEVTISNAEEILANTQSLQYDVILSNNPGVLNRFIQEFAHPPVLISLSGQEHGLGDLVVEDDLQKVCNQLIAMAKLRYRNLNHEQQLTRELVGVKAALEAQIRTAQRLEVMKEALIYNVSHEMRTPLLQMKAAVKFLEEGVYKHNDTDVVALAEQATARLESFVNNISHLTSSIKDMQLGPVQVQDSIQHAMREISRSWQHKNEKSRIQLHVDSNLPPVMGNKLALGTVLELLIDNALKFSKQQQKPVEVYAQQKGKHVVITVADQGIGIARTEFDYIFDTFYQVDSSPTRAYGGAGLGLAIVRMIMEHHNIRVKVESRLGKYTRFTFKLPIVKV